MKLSFSLEKWYALSAGLANQNDWLTWSHNENHDWMLPLPKSQRIPMMQARRMSEPSRLAVDVGLELINETKIDFAIFISRHGELERTYKILTTLNNHVDVSPTDFALSVHNTASGLLTIIAKQAIPISSISANRDGFQQGLIEAQALLKQGYNRILLIDFDGSLPNIYQTQVNSSVSAYAMGIILTPGNTISIEATKKYSPQYQTQYPQSLAFLHGFLSKKQTFMLQGYFHDWQWTINHE
ncbi:beta-ketoacyl synthase chain length factor [Orbus mooreae]|uniref:beta-ketoacyl synthase chain length factor n=1 Tax=Orbus mooreae TaxID=3074107 RepID=UPI00370D33F2